MLCIRRLAASPTASSSSVSTSKKSNRAALSLSGEGLLGIEVSSASAASEDSSSSEVSALEGIERTVAANGVEARGPGAWTGAMDTEDFFEVV